MKMRKILSLLSIMVVLAMLSQACNLFSSQPESSEVIDETEGIPVVEPISEETEEKVELVWSPELIYHLPYDEKIASVAFSQNGTMIATGIHVQSDLLNAEDGSEIRFFDLNHTADGLMFTPDNTHLAAAVSVGGVSLLDINTGEEIHNFHRGYDNHLSVSPNGNLIATGNREGVVWLWDINSAELLAELDPSVYVDDYSEYLTSITFSPDGQSVASGHWDGNIFLWDVTSGELIDHFKPTSDFCTAWDLAFSPDGNYLAVGSGNVDFKDVIRIWDVANGSILHDLAEVNRTGSMNAPVVFSQDGNLLAAGGTEGIYFWALPEFELVHHIPIEDTNITDWVTDLAFSPNSQQLLAGFWAGYAQLWQVQPIDSTN